MPQTLQQLHTQITIRVICLVEIMHLGRFAFHSAQQTGARTPPLAHARMGKDARHVFDDDIFQDRHVSFVGL